MVPANLLLLAWVWLGRLAFGVGGWLLLILLPVVAILGVALLITTILAFTQDSPRPDGRKALSGTQVWSQSLVWVGMLGFGLFVPDFGDTEDSVQSSLTRLFGYSDDLLSTSFLIALVFGLLTVVAYLVLLVALIAAHRSRRRPQVSLAG
jgi:hypothetical protein